MGIASASCGSGVETGSGAGDSTSLEPIAPTLTYSACTLYGPGGKPSCASSSGTGQSSSSPRVFDRSAAQSIDFSIIAPSGRTISSVTCTESDPSNRLSYSTPSGDMLRISVGGNCVAGGGETMSCTATENGGGTVTVYLTFQSSVC